MRVNYVIVFVSDLKRSIAFYRDVLGLPLKFETPGWTEFATEGATLALHISAGTTAQDELKETPAGRCRPGLSVPDLDAFHKRMVANKVRCLEEPKEVFGTRIAQYLDPDGLAISVSQARKEYENP
jgi:lactoylglutathione lyase